MFLIFQMDLYNYSSALQSVRELYAQFYHVQVFVVASVLLCSLQLLHFKYHFADMFKRRCSLRQPAQQRSALQWPVGGS